MNLKKKSLIFFAASTLLLISALAIGFVAHAQQNSTQRKAKQAQIGSDVTRNIEKTVTKNNASHQGKDVSESDSQEKDYHEKDSHEKPSYTSSLTISTTGNDDDTPVSELEKLVKITSDQAKKFAEDAIGGTATEVKLENDDGNVVYAVVIGDQEVKIDAGDGKVLLVEKDDAGDKAGPEQDENDVNEKGAEIKD